MNGQHRVDSRDLEDAQDAWIRRDEVDPTFGPGVAACVHEGPHTRRVEERAAREIDDDVRGRRGAGDGFLEAGRGGEIELTGYAQHRRTGRRRFHPYVKIARRGHGRRV